METIKAIETVYNGYRFRSRLEARWAVFFDTLGVKYEYETANLCDATGHRYLPDFLLPDQYVWLEIKPVMPDEKYINRLLGVAEAIKRDYSLRAQLIALSVGDPWLDPNTRQHAYQLLRPSAHFDRGNSQFSFVLDSKWPLFWVECPCCGLIAIDSAGVYGWYRDETWGFYCWICDARECPGRCHAQTDANAFWFYKGTIVVRRLPGYLTDTPRLMAAYAAARQARFEFGESGALGAVKRSKYSVGQKVQHKVFGRGTVEGITSRAGAQQSLNVRFEGGQRLQVDADAPWLEIVEGWVP